jgi:hypothetical protein
MEVTGGRTEAGRDGWHGSLTAATVTINFGVIEVIESGKGGREREGRRGRKQEGRRQSWL